MFEKEDSTSISLQDTVNSFIITLVHKIPDAGYSFLNWICIVEGSGLALNKNYSAIAPSLFLLRPNTNSITVVMSSTRSVQMNIKSMQN
ncbi:MAG: hypothetical protein V4685_05640 [Bacteroidota bacterium]